MNPPPTLWYRLWKGFAQAFFVTFFRLRVEGQENIPRSGGFVVSLNHVSIFDPPLVGVLVRRPMRFMAKKELFGFRPFGALLLSVGSIPIRRGEADRTAIRACVAALREGYGLSVFPEGTRNIEQRGRPRGGAAYLATKAQVPIVPGAIIGRYGVGRTLTVRFGRPMMPPGPDSSRIDHESVHALSDTLMQEIERLGRGEPLDRPLTPAPPVPADPGRPEGP